MECFSQPGMCLIGFCGIIISDPAFISIVDELVEFFMSQVSLNLTTVCACAKAETTELDPCVAQSDLICRSADSFFVRILSERGLSVQKCCSDCRSGRCLQERSAID